MKLKGTLKLTLNLIGNSNDETNFPHKSLLTDTQVSKIPKAFTNTSSTNIQFSKLQLSKMIQTGSSITELINLFRLADKITNKAKDLFNKKCHLMM